MSNNKQNHSLSVDQIKSTFIKINDQIQSLHEYSNKDFYALNDSFKNNFQASNKIFNNSRLLISLLNENSTFTILKDLNSFKDNIISFYNEFKTIIKDNLTDFDTIENSSNLLKIHLNNVNQNLLTFNFLISNYNIFHSPKSNFTSSIYNQIQKIKYYIDKLINNSDQLIHKTNLLEQKCEEIIEFISIAQEGLIGELEESLNMIESKKNDANDKIQEIESKGELSQNINDIITNLQYHDILRQKMEHIQKIHNEVIEKLNLLENSLNNEDQDIKIAEYLLYIKEIAELQSAQLIHVNKKYQVAIKIISENICKIGENVNSVNIISQDIMGYSSKNNSNFLFNVSFTIDNVYKKFLEILYSFIEIVSNLKQFKNIQSEYIYEFDNINKFFVDYKKTSQEFLSILNQNAESNSNINKQFKAISEEVLNSKTEINANLNKIIGLLYKICSTISSISLIDNAQNNFLGFADVFVQKFKIHTREANQKLIENKNICRSIDSNIQHSLNQVKYYEYFEKVIEEVTNELNSLNETISLSVKSELFNKDSKLNTLKQHYTTGSEHNIHEIYVEKGISETKRYNDEINEEDNIEFF